MSFTILSEEKKSVIEMMYQISEIKQKKTREQKKRLISKLRREDKPKFQGKKKHAKKRQNYPQKT